MRQHKHMAQTAGHALAHKTWVWLSCHNTRKNHGHDGRIMTLLVTISSFNSKQCKTHFSNHPCCWNNYSNTGYSCHKISVVCYQKLWWSMTQPWGSVLEHMYMNTSVFDAICLPSTDASLINLMLQSLTVSSPLYSILLVFTQMANFSLTHTHMRVHILWT